MYIRSLHIKNLKRLRDLSLTFTNDDGSPRMWTVLIGENGTGKTSILQAIALTAAGTLRVNDLAGKSFAHLVDLRQRSTMEVRARYGFTPSSLVDPKRHPLQKGEKADLRLTSVVNLKPKETSLRAHSWYGEDDHAPKGSQDPLDNARASETHLWFVIGYGVHRVLPESARMPELASSSVYESWVDAGP